MQRAYSYRDDPSVPAFADDKPLVSFDGDCVLCSSSAQFLMRRDRQARIRLAVAQSTLGQALYNHYGLDPATYGTFILVDQGRALLKSEAAIRIARILGGPWAGASMLRVLPTCMRDGGYDLVARNRFKMFGRRSTCFRPEAEDRGRFLA